MKEYNIDYSLIPEHMRSSLQRYIEKGIHPGDFLYSVLCNDFVKACFYADYINRKKLLRYASWLMQECPIGAWGSKDIIKQWEIDRGLEGIRTQSGNGELTENWKEVKKS